MRVFNFILISAVFYQIWKAKDDEDDTDFSESIEEAVDFIPQPYRNQIVELYKKHVSVMDEVEGIPPDILNTLPVWVSHVEELKKDCIELDKKIDQDPRMMGLRSIVNNLN